MCYGKTEKDAQQTAHRYFRWAIAGWRIMPELPNTEAFAAASKNVSPETVAAEISCGPSADRHLEAIGRYIHAGYDHLILVQIGPEQDAFVEFFERELRPEIGHREAA